MRPKYFFDFQKKKKFFPRPVPVTVLFVVVAYLTACAIRGEKTKFLSVFIKQFSQVKRDR